MTIRVGMWLYGLNNAATNSARRPRKEDYHAGEIVAETTQLWLVRVGKSERHRRVNKRTMLERDGHYRGSPRKWWIEGDLNAHLFCEEHARHIGHAVMAHKDAQDLKRIAIIVGYNWDRVRSGI